MITGHDTSFYFQQLDTLEWSAQMWTLHTHPYYQSIEQQQDFCSTLM